MDPRRKPTVTSSFGVSRRESHDASAFYQRFTPPTVSTDEAVAASPLVDTVVCQDARAMTQLPDRCVALVVTSPPYFAGKEYERALGEGHVPGTYLEYLGLLTDVFAECVRVLEPGGRIVVNVANLGRRPYRSLSADVVRILQDDLRLLLRGEVVWRKQRGAAGNCAWGSFQRPGNPVLRDLTERLVVASKGRFDRAVPPRRRHAGGLPAHATLTRDEFMEATLDVWEIPPESATRVGHPAPFPVALPERCIHLYTYTGDLVLDPFMGSGSTAVAAVRTGRRFVGYDTDPAYVAAAQARVAQEWARLAGGPASAADLPPVPEIVPADTDPVVRALREGRAAREVAAILVREAGFVDVGPTGRLPHGLDLAWQARDRDGSRWWFDVTGGFTVAPSGLRCSDDLWAALGRATVLQAVQPGARLVLLTTEAPSRGPAVGALRAVTGPGRPVAAVCELTAVADRERLRVLAAGDGAPRRA